MSRRRAGACGPLMLASVRDVAEARMAVAAGADVIDCKDPSAGALGALPGDMIRAIVAEVGGRAPVSATIGDEAAEADRVTAAVAATAATGVAIVKVGVVAGPSAREAITRAGAGLGTRPRCGLVAVFFADAGVPGDLVAVCAEAGFSGVMLDTSTKAQGNLISHAGAGKLASFVARARGCGLWCGLAGGLRADDVGLLSALDPDILGFRGGLCRNADRRASLDAGAFEAVRRALYEGSGPRRARAEPTETRA